MPPCTLLSKKTGKLTHCWIRSILQWPEGVGVICRQLSMQWLLTSSVSCSTSETLLMLLCCIKFCPSDFSTQTLAVSACCRWSWAHGWTWQAASSGYSASWTSWAWVPRITGTYLLGNASVHWHSPLSSFHQQNWQHYGSQTTREQQQIWSHQCVSDSCKVILLPPRTC